MIKLWKFGWAGYYNTDGRDYKTLKGRNHVEDLNIYGKRILKWILKKYSGMM
jgi:hypothetical protein